MIARHSASRSELRSWKPPSGALCRETQSREVMAKLVHDVVAEAMRLGLHGGAPPERVENANGARFGRPLTKVRNG